MSGAAYSWKIFLVTFEMGIDIWQFLCFQKTEIRENLNYFLHEDS